jgi:DNA-binding GntR family transcriptional regulator
MVLISMNVESTTGEVIAKTKRFGLNILTESQADLAVRFARKGPDKFEGVATATGAHGMPLLVDALATLECSVTEQVRVATHVVFLARVQHAVARIGAPLAYFRGEFGRLQLSRDDHVLEELRRRILSRELPVEEMTVAEIAERFGLPGDATHYALVQLTFDGLLTAQPGGRFTVRPLTAEVIADALRARRVIEFGAVAVALRGGAVADLTGLRALAEQTDPAQHRGDVDSWVKAYVVFHEGVVGLPGTSSAVEAYRRLNTPPMVLSLARDRAAGRHGRESAVRAHADHLELVAALEERDEVRAFAVVDRHFEDSIAFVTPEP